MRSTFFSRTRRWIGASALAVIIGLSGGASFFVATSQHAAAELLPPRCSRRRRSRRPRHHGPVSFADLVDTVKPAVVSIVVEATGQADDTPTAARSTTRSRICRTTIR